MNPADLKNLSKEEKLLVWDLLEEKERRLREAKALYEPNEGQRLVHSSTATERIVTAGNGSGKCHGALTPIMLQDGTTKFAKDIAVGDLLLGPDSFPRVVKALGQGRDEMFEIRPCDRSGKPYQVNADHILSLQCCTSDPRYPEKKGEVVNISVREFLKWPDRKRRLFYGWRPKGIYWEEKSLKIPPYILGIWLGDGTAREASITKMDPIIIEAWTSYLLGQGCRVRISGQKYSECKTFHAAGRNPVKDLLCSYQLIKNKHIPHCYKTGSQDQRMELLAGLLDTDGHLASPSKKKAAQYYEITQKRKQLSEDIAFVARSLGFKVTWREKKVNGVVYYRLNILGEIWRIPCRSKKAHPRPLQRDHSRYKLEVVSIGIGNYYGFTLDSDHLYLLSDFTVTHNTVSLIHEIFWTAQGYHPIRKEFIPVPNKSVVLLDSPDKVTNLYLPEMAKWFTIDPTKCYKHGKPYVTEVVAKNGSSIQFYFQGQEPLVFESIQVDGMIAIDEPCPRWQYVALKRGARVKNRDAKVLMIGTPLAQAWVRKEIVEPWSRGERPDTACFRFGTRVNEKNLSKGYIENFSRILTDQEKKVRLEGEFYDLSGLALNHLFDRKVHMVPRFEVPSDWPCVVTVDPHPSKAHVATVLACDRDGYLYYVDELQRKEPPRTFATTLIEKFQRYRITDVVVDSLGSMDGTGGEGFKSFIQVLNEELRARGLRARSTSWDEKQDEAFIARIQDGLLIPLEPNNFGLCTPRIRFFDDCYGIVRDIENVQWQKMRGQEMMKPKLDITDSDFLACLKYALATNLNPNKDKARSYAPPHVSSYGASKEPPQVRRFKAQLRSFLRKRTKLREKEEDF